MVRAAVASLTIAALLAGCAHKAGSSPQPQVQLVPVQVAVPVPCPALSSLGAEPAYPDTDDAIEGAATIGQLAALYAKGRILRAQRLAEYAAAKTACLF